MLRGPRPAACVRAAKLLGWTAIVGDARGMFLTPERMPSADILVQKWPEEALAGQPAEPRMVDPYHLANINGEWFLFAFDHLRKNLPALPPNEVRDAITAMRWTRNVYLADKELLKKIRNRSWTVVMPHEDVMISLAEQYLKGCEIIFDNFFLRWDKERTLAKQDVVPDVTLSNSLFDEEIMFSLDSIKEYSSDFWRQVSAMLVFERRVLKFAYNTQVPDKESPYFYGDPRFNFSRGVHIELSTAEHAEAKVIALCAKEGIALYGTSLYVTTFPCPPCAKLIATAGISRLYFREGYSMLDAENILKIAGVELIQVK